MEKRVVFWHITAAIIAAVMLFPSASAKAKEEPLADEELLARIVYLEARGEPDEGQQAVAQVVLNRLKDGTWGDTLSEVIYAPGQFNPARLIKSTKPTPKEYRNVQAVLQAEGPILPAWVMYFGRKHRDGKTYLPYSVVGAHYFGGYKRDRIALDGKAD